MRYLYSLLVVIFLALFVQMRTDGFREARIFSNFENRKEWEIVNYDLTSYFKQKYHYLGRGRQCFCFESEDHKYVLKFFNHNRFRYPQFVYYLPFKNLWHKKVDKQRGRLNFYFGSYKLAFSELKEECALIAVHLNKSDNLHLEAEVFDKCGLLHKLNIDSLSFVLQKKAKPLFEALKKSSNKKPILDSFSHLLDKRILKGIGDDDLEVGFNYGLIGDEVVIFDCGRFYKTFDSNKERLKSTKLLYRWLLKNYPDEVDFLPR